MASHRRKRRHGGQPAVPPARRRKSVPIAAALVGVAVLAVVVVLNLPGCQPKTAKTGAKSKPAATTSAKESRTPPPGPMQTGEAAKPAGEAAAPTGEPAIAPPPAVAAPDRKASASQAKPGFDVLKGKWVRPDGGYVVEVRSVDASGKMDASYANPGRINVSQAKASRDGPTVKVFIELRDVNYPGSTYNLTYDPQSDQLKGIYFQAALQERYEVFFVRMK